MFFKKVILYEFLVLYEFQPLQAQKGGKYTRIFFDRRQLFFNLFLKGLGHFFTFLLPKTLISRFCSIFRVLMIHAI